MRDAVRNDERRQIVAECVRQKKLKAKDVDVMTRALWAGIHGITSLLIGYEHFPWGDRQAVVRTLIDSLIDGDGSQAHIDRLLA